MMKIAHRSRAAVVALFALAALISALLPRAASAHAFLVKTQPAAGSVVAPSIGEVRLTFTERVDLRPDRVSVTNDAGQRVDLRNARLAQGDALTVTVGVPQLANGIYTVRYALLSSDTHPVGGAFRFGVGVSPADVLSGAPAQETGVTRGAALDGASRWIILLGLMLILGPVVVRLCILVPLRGSGARVGDDPVRHFAARAVRWAWIGVIVLIAGLIVNVIAASVASSLGTTTEALRPGALVNTLTGRYGTLWLSRLALLLVPSLALPLLAADQELGEAVAEGETPDDSPAPARGGGLGGWWAILVAGGALLLATALSGHAAATVPVPVSVAVDWAHLAATVVWIGGLLALALILPGVVRSLGAAAGGAAVATILPRFSALALICVQVIVVTGFYQTWTHVASPAELGTKVYGRTLLVKLVLIAPLLALGAINRLVILPRLRAGAGEEARPETTRRLWRTIWGEAALGVLVLAVVGLLTALPPARGAAVAASPDQATATSPVGSVTLAGTAGPLMVTLTIGPTGTGPATLAVTLADPVGTSVEEATVRLRLIPPGGAVPQEVTLTPRSGRYTGLGDLAAAGPWRMEATVAPRAGDGGTATFALDLPSGGARTILAGADAAMNRLTGLREHQVLSSGGPAVTSDYEWAAPDRMHLRTDAGSETIVVGTKRYDRAGTGPWQVSDWPEPTGYRWPQSDYARNAAEVTILGREEVDGVPSWIITFLDTASSARYTFWIGVQDGLIRQLRMVATGHYMQSRFSEFNEQIAIEAPLR